MTALTCLARPHQLLCSGCFFWLFGRARTTDNGHPLFALPPPRASILNYVPLHLCTPLGAHHGHTRASLTHSRVHVMVFYILACLLAMHVVHGACLVCLSARFGVFVLSACSRGCRACCVRACRSRGCRGCCVRACCTRVCRCLTCPCLSCSVKFLLGDRLWAHVCLVCLIVCCGVFPISIGPNRNRDCIYII